MDTHICRYPVFINLLNNIIIYLHPFPENYDPMAEFENNILVLDVFTTGRSRQVRSNDAFH